MKWFKHMTASFRDERLARLVADGGMEAYGTWWRVLEIVAEGIEKDSPPTATYPISHWAHLLVTRGSLVMSRLSRLPLTVERHDSDVTVTIHNLLKYRDEYTRKSGHCREQEAEAEAEADTKDVVPVLNGWKATSFDEFWGDCVWAKIARGKAKVAYYRWAKTPELAKRINQAAKDQGPGLLADAERQGRGVLHPTTWLNGERWLDEPVLFAKSAREMM